MNFMRFDSWYSLYQISFDKVIASHVFSPFHVEEITYQTDRLDNGLAYIHWNKRPRIYIWMIVGIVMFC